MEYKVKVTRMVDVSELTLEEKISFAKRTKDATLQDILIHDEAPEVRVALMSNNSLDVHFFTEVFAKDADPQVKAALVKYASQKRVDKISWIFYKTATLLFGTCANLTVEQRQTIAAFLYLFTRDRVHYINVSFIENNSKTPFAPKLEEHYEALMFTYALSPDALKTAMDSYYLNKDTIGRNLIKFWQFLNDTCTFPKKANHEEFCKFLRATARIYFLVARKSHSFDLPKELLLRKIGEYNSTYSRAYDFVERNFDKFSKCSKIYYIFDEFS